MDTVQCCPKVYTLRRISTCDLPTDGEKFPALQNTKWYEKEDNVTAHMCVSQNLKPEGLTVYFYEISPDGLFANVVRVIDRVIWIDGGVKAE